MVRAIVAAALLACLGCSSKPAPPNPERMPLRHLTILYGKYLGAHQGMPPKNEEQFKKFIKGLNENQLTTAGVTLAEVDGLFVSPRDGQPYDVRYGNAPPSEGMAAVVMEHTGKGGKRLVGYSLGKIEEVDETTYQEIRFTKP